MEIRHKVIVVTGTTKGIGRAFCERVALDSTHLILINRRKDSEFEQKLKNLGAASVQEWIYDLSNLESVYQLGNLLKTTSVDILFNNAGLLTGGLLEEQPNDDIHRMLTVNINAVIHLTKAILPMMLKRKTGKIINHSSITSMMLFPCASTYSASKAAVSAFTESLRKELKDTGVTTLTLFTPGVKTHMFDSIEELYGAHIKMNFSSIPVKEYVEYIYEAIRQDLDLLQPGGLAGINLKISKYLPSIFDYIVYKSFSR